MEILAPCGNAESFTAAINTGADAVYLGLRKFSARGNAANFTPAQLAEMRRESLLYGVKIYLAVNTLIFGEELDSLRESLREVRGYIDAVITQDLAAAAIAREFGFALHASTQMSVTNSAALEVLKELGFTRAVLARELSREEIAAIAAAGKRLGVETEVFVHGAHCVSVSGQCYMSSLFGGSSGRSGNRGLCAQPCRLDFRAEDCQYALSLKDLSLIGHIAELREMGVTSLKIEGRMKRPEYVAAAVDSCRKALEGDEPDISLLRRVFSRGGFSDGYYCSDCADMRGVRTKEDVENTAAALKQIKSLYKYPRKRYSVEFSLTVRAGVPCRAVVSIPPQKIEVTVTGAVPEIARTRELTAETAAAQLSKLTATIFEASAVHCDIEPGLSLSAQSLNELRRVAVEQLSEVLQGFHPCTPVGDSVPEPLPESLPIGDVKCRYKF